MFPLIVHLPLMSRSKAFGPHLGAGGLNGLYQHTYEHNCAQVMSMAEGLRVEHGNGLSVPSAIVCISAKEGTGVKLVREALEPLLSSLAGNSDRI